MVLHLKVYFNQKSKESSRGFEGTLVFVCQFIQDGKNGCLMLLVYTITHFNLKNKYILDKEYYIYW